MQCNCTEDQLLAWLANCASRRDLLTSRQNLSRLPDLVVCCTISICDTAQRESDAALRWSHLASLQLAWSRWPTPLYWAFLPIRAAALAEKSLAVMLRRPGTSRAKRTDRRPDAASASSTRKPSCRTKHRATLKPLGSPPVAEFSHCSLFGTVHFSLFRAATISRRNRCSLVCDDFKFPTCNMPWIHLESRDTCQSDHGWEKHKQDCVWLFNSGWVSI